MKRPLEYYCPHFCVAAAVFLLAVAVAMDIRDKKSVGMDLAAHQAFIRARVRAEVALAIERQDYVDAARLSFPSLADKTSPLYHACIARYGDLVAENSPMLNRADWPLLVAQEEAARLGVSPTITLK